MTTRHHDLVLIGTGSGNTIIDEQFDDLDIAIVEKGTFGGTCLNVGCIPTKMFVLPSDRVLDGEDSTRLGVTFARPDVDWAAIRDRVFGRIDPIAAGGEKYRRDGKNITLYQGVAHFTGRDPLTLDTGTGVSITADRWVVAAGGRPGRFPVDGLAEAGPEQGVYTNESIMRMDRLPARVAIIGGGYIGAEFSHILGGLGAEVTWVQRGPRVLMAQDETISRAFTDIASERHHLRLGSRVTAAVRSGGTWALTITEDDGLESVVEVDAVLVAIGRVPNSDLLDVAAAGLPTHDDGRLVVDEFQRTPVEGVFALGDISSDYQLKHVANHEARIVKHNLLHPDDLRASDHRFVPSAVFTHPQIATVGKTEQELREAGASYVSKVQEFGDVAYGWALEDQTGICKVLVDPKTRLILGAHLMGPMSSTLIQPLIQAMHFGQTADEVATGQYWIHPALAEVVENALLGTR